MTIPHALRVIVTLLFVGVAILVGRWLWRRYEVEPWTRDGRVRANIVQVAPDVSGLVTAVEAQDNQPIRRGQILFEIDRARFQLALAQARAAIGAQRAALAQARREDRRDRALGDLVSSETAEQASAHVAELEAGLAQALVNRDAAKLNLDRTTIVAPIDGVAANVALEPGDYAAAGHPVMGVVDPSSLHVDGYFEETKLARIHVGDPVAIRLMGDKVDLPGHVQSISPGIEDRELSPSANLLPNVNPTFSWVRLAQRIPVRIVFDGAPRDVRLIAGRTATVTVRPRLAAGRAAR
jgi:RND family efflux transporter MFP subunit